MFAHALFANIIMGIIMLSNDVPTLTVVLIIVVLVYLLFLLHDERCIITILEQRIFGLDVDRYTLSPFISRLIPHCDLTVHSHHAALTGTGIAMASVLCLVKLSLLVCKNYLSTPV